MTTQKFIATLRRRIAVGAAGVVGRMMEGIAGREGAARVRASYGSYHDAAKHDATNADWRERLASADQSILDDLDTMIARSRLMLVNDGFTASCQGAYRRHVVGGGITARSAARDPTSTDGEMLTDYNKGMDLQWQRYFWDPRLCDAEQTKSMGEKQQLWMNELFGAGGLFIVMNYVPQRRGVGLVLQEIEYEQRDQSVMEYQGRPVRGGIETGEQGQPLGYHLFTASHPLEEFATRSVRVPAERVIHLFRQDRVRQRLGAPWTRAVLSRVRNLAMYDNYTMLQARGRAAYTGFIKQTGGAGILADPRLVAKSIGAPASATDEALTAGEIRVNVTQGLFPVLQPNQEPVFPANQTPDSMYPPFVMEQLKGIAAGTGLDLATVSRWWADMSFAASKQSRLDIWAEVDWIQDLLFIRKSLRIIREQFIALAIRERRVKAPGYLVSDEWQAAYEMTNWQGPPRYSADRVDDMAAWKMGFGLGIASPQEYCNEQGKDVRDALAEMKEFRRLAEEAGVLDMLLPQWRGTDAREPRPGKDRAERGRRGTDDGEDVENILAERQGRLLKQYLQGQRTGGGNGKNHA